LGAFKLKSILNISACLVILAVPAFCARKPKYVPTAVPSMDGIRKVYVTGLSTGADKEGAHLLENRTCMEPVLDRSQADAIAVLGPHFGSASSGSSGFVVCNSTPNGANCTDTGTGLSSSVHCLPNGTCVARDYDLGWFSDLLQGLDTRISNKFGFDYPAYVRVIILTPQGRPIWSYDQWDADVAGSVPAWHSWWTDPLNIAVGCGQGQKNWKRKHK
jgi:hypothetical protein